MVEFFIIVTGWNCSGRARRCYDSLVSQTYTDFRAVFISDNSTDGTTQEVQNLPKKDWLTIKVNFENMGAAYNRCEAIKTHDPKDVIMIMGMDDELFPDCLETIAKEYKKGVWMTYGNWQNQFGHLNSMELYFNDNTHRNREYRLDKYRSTAPNTFKRFLFNSIPIEDFKIDGEWLRTCTEAPLIFACLEMCGRDRIGVIKKPIYLYNKLLANGTLRTQGSGYKRDILDKICKRTPKNVLK